MWQIYPFETGRILTQLPIAIGRGFEPSPDYTDNAGTAFWLVAWTWNIPQIWPMY